LQQQGPGIFFSRTPTGEGTTPRLKETETREDLPSDRGLLSTTNFRVTQLMTGLGVGMGIIAWIVLGLVAGLIANMLIPGRRQQGLILTCVIGIVGALAGGWVATKIFHIHSLQGFFNLSTWLTAIAGAAVLLLVYHLVTSRSGGSSRSRRSSRRGFFAHR
jgi:uncharacterized membrane protein YeaQ/YmgE (transglycosylase-associated protein family)